MAIIWTIMGIVIPFFIGIALSFLGYNPPEFRNARALVWASFGVLSAWTIAWLFLTPATRETQLYTAAGVGFLNVVGINVCLLFIGKREQLYRGLISSGAKEESSKHLISPPLPSKTDVGVQPQIPDERKQFSIPTKELEDPTDSHEPFSSGADKIEIDTGINLVLHIGRTDSAGNSGLVLIVDNNRLDAISKISLTIYSAQSFDANHKDFRSGLGFNSTRVINIGVVPPSCSSKPLWIVRKERAYSNLLAGDDNSHQMIWPDNDKSDDQRWQLSLGITAETVPANSTERPEAFATMKMKLVALWVKESNHFEIGGASALTT